MGKEVQSILEFSPELLEMIVGHLKDEKSSKEAAVICPTFHEKICYLRKDKLQSLLLNQEVIDNDETFESIMGSKRRVNDIKIGYCDEIESEKYFAVLEKFKPYMKKVSIETLSLSRENLFGLFIAVSEVMELNLDIRELSWKSKRRFMELKTFSELKSLRLFSCPKLSKLFDVIPNDSLETLEVCSKNEPKLLQAFISRQKNIKKLKIKAFYDIDHLVLEEFTLLRDETDFNQGRLRSLLMKQPELRFLKLNAGVDELSFSQVCQLRKLESLKVSLIGEGDRSCIGALNNLKHLTDLKLIDSVESEFVFWQGSAFLGQLPKLQTLSLLLEDKLDTEIIAAMSGGMGSLQELEIEGCQISLLSRVIGNFRTLKKLQVDSGSATDNQNATPSRRNECLEELILTITFCPGKTTYDAIKACSNLKRLDLTATEALNADLFDCVQSQPQLKSFRYSDVEYRDEAPGQQMDELQQSALMGIIEHFRKTPGFLELELSYHSSHNLELEALFGEDIGKVDILNAIGFGFGEDVEIYKFFSVSKKQEA